MFAHRIEAVAPPRSAVVLGGSGFIGTRLLHLLAARGCDDLTSVDTRSPRVELPGVRHVSGDVRQPLPIAEPTEVLYNLAAVHTTPGHKPHEYYDTNIAGALNATQYAREHDVKTIVFTSSISIYGPGEDEKDETTPPSPTSEYGRSKLLAEQIHRTWLGEDPTRHLVIVRPAVVFGPGENGNFDRMLSLIQRRVFIYPGRTDTIKSCGYVGELVSSMEWVRSRKTHLAVYNFAYPERTTIQRIANAIARATGQPRPKHCLPLRPMMQAARPFEALSRIGIRTGINRERLLKLVRSTNVYPRYLIENGYPFATDLDTGIADWLQARYTSSLLHPKATLPERTNARYEKCEF